MIYAIGICANIVKIGMGDIISTSIRCILRQEILNATISNQSHRI